IKYSSHLEARPDKGLQYLAKPDTNFVLTVVIGSTLIEKGRKELCSLLKQNLDIFAWKPADITGVPQNIAEHRLNIREGYSPVRQKKRGQAPERNKAIQEEVEKLVDAGIMKEVHYHSWLSNPVMVKKHDGSRLFFSLLSSRSSSSWRSYGAQ
ncbi:hypothetical protein Tco_1076461, partial [Tanacetum coccineum]